MSDYLRITKSGIIPYEWDKETRHYVPATSERTALFGLRNRCEIAPDVTLLDIFNAVEKDEPLMVFIRHYSWNSWMKEFHEQARQPRPAQEDDCEDLEALVISYVVDIRDDDLSASCDLTGIGKSGTHFSVSLSPMNELAHLPVRLNPKVLIRRKFDVIGESIYYFSLLDVLDTIYWDISFHGSPTEMQEASDELRDAIADADEGECRPIGESIDDLMAKIDAEQRTWEDDLCNCAQSEACDCAKRHHHCKHCGKSLQLAA